MIFRLARKSDSSGLVRLDRQSYGKYGANVEYFTEKLNQLDTKVIVAENNGKLYGFSVLEILEQNQIPKDFSHLEFTNPITGKWAFIIAFTTKSNFNDLDSDSKFLQFTESIARKMGCTIYCVPLSINHPYTKNNVFEFWEKNGYVKAGTIKWIVSMNENIDCFFYRKNVIKEG